VCDHLPRFLDSGGQAVFTHQKGGAVSLSYTRNGQPLSTGIGSSSTVAASGGGGGGSSFGGPGGISRGGSGLPPGIYATGGSWSAAATPQQMSNALSFGLTHHPDGRPRTVGGNSTLHNSP
jgi:hypothetical protein